MSKPPRKPPADPQEPRLKLVGTSELTAQEREAFDCAIWFLHKVRRLNTRVVGELFGVDSSRITRGAQAHEKRVKDREDAEAVAKAGDQEQISQHMRPLTINSKFADSVRRQQQILMMYQEQFRLCPCLAHLSLVNVAAESVRDLTKVRVQQQQLAFERTKASKGQPVDLVGRVQIIAQIPHNQRDQLPAAHYTTVEPVETLDVQPIEPTDE